MKIYVGNLSFNLGSQEVRDLFAEYGKVESADVIIDRETGRSRGFAFVKMASDEAGEHAIAALHGFSLDGRILKVNEANNVANGNRENYGKPRFDQGRSRGGHDNARTGGGNSEYGYYGGRSW